MIEYSIDTIDGVQFLKDMKFVKPYEYENGIMIERIPLSSLNRRPELDGILLLMGMRRVGSDYCTHSYIYTLYPFGYYGYKLTHHLLRVYWWMVRFLYNNARIFQQIPEAECFSWRYFTPYVWYEKLKNRFKQKR